MKKKNKNELKEFQSLLFNTNIEGKKMLTIVVAKCSNKS